MIADKFQVPFGSAVATGVPLKELAFGHADDVKRIDRSLATWSLWVEPDEEGVLVGEGKKHLEVMLMLGLGTVILPKPDGWSDYAGVAARACELIRCRQGQINPRAVEHAMSDVRKLYRTHLKRSEKRRQLNEAKSQERKDSPESVVARRLALSSSKTRFHSGRPGFASRISGNERWLLETGSVECARVLAQLLEGCGIEPVLFPHGPFLQSNQG
ncbi:MAG: hypothetical protein HKN82_15210 [Akkermansiaceae bacterium]|nr:hypothetical protein [Akkermansiaceae bacterium]NNM28600.1 hypothetical protein [Akkermansiaceae bacterium]